MIDQLKAPLYSLDSEQGILGCVFNDCELLNAILGGLDPEDFYIQNHKTVLQAMVDARAASPTGKFDVVGVRDALLKMGALSKIGGVDYLVECHERATGAGVLPYDIKMVKDFRKRRQVVAAGQRLLNISVADDIDDILAEARSQLDGITTRQRSGAVLLHDEVCDAVDAMLEGEPGVSTGMRQLDWTLCGMHAAELLVVGARPSMGKTALALSIILNLITRGVGVLLISLEMGKREIVQRLLCMHAAVNMQLARHGVRAGGLSEADLTKLRDSGNAMMNEKWPLVIVEGASVTADSLKGVVSRERKQHKIELLVVDYLQLLPAGRATARENRVSQVTELSRCMKLLAMDEQIPVIALSQLNRAAEGRDGHKPRLSDLRESGAIEQDADVVMLLHREDYYHQNESGYVPDHTMSVLIAKHRNGPTGYVTLNFHPESIRVTDQESKGRIDDEP